MLFPGDIVKDCEVIAPLGSGGMAQLYLARRRGVGGFSRLVTLKLVHQHLIDDAEIVRLFLDEARISAHVAHPNVVNVEEVGSYGGSYFIAMEYVHGVSLAELSARLMERRLRLRPKLCVWLAAQVAEALHAAHEAKDETGAPLEIVHGDVSPQNVLIGHTGHVKLIDFGVANSQCEADRSSSGRPVLGKLRYMAPEQLRCEHTDRRTDLYSLGIMLWEMLAGRSLLRCQRLDDERDWALRETPPPPSKYSTHVATSLDRVVLKAIACEPSERYESAFQFRSALLRADPAAAQLDAPRVAALMRSMLGDELDRRCASWPREVAGQLEPTAEITASQLWSLNEFTADNGAGTPSAADSEPAPAPVLAPPDPSRVAVRMLLPESALDTLSLVPVLVGPSPLPSARTFRTVELGWGCLVIGVFLGTFLASSRPAETKPRLETVVHAALDHVEPKPLAPASSDVHTRSVVADAAEAAVAGASEEPELDTEPQPPKRGRWARKESRSSASRRAAWRANKLSYASSRSYSNRKAQHRSARDSE